MCYDLVRGVMNSRVLGAAAAAAFLCVNAARAADGGAPDGGASTPSPGAVLASYCSEQDLECTLAPLKFNKTIQQPFAVDLDTGWIPKSSDLQVRFFVKVPAQTTVELEGELETTWPEAMTLKTPGGGRGFIDFEYGLQVGAQAKIDLTVLGVGIKWQGNIPFVPQVDFTIDGDSEFKAWAFAPNGASANGVSKPVTLFQYNVLELAGIPSQISKGGISLDLSGELDATYETDRIVIEPAESGDTDITSEGDATQRGFLGGAFVEYDVWPEGRVEYTGTLHLLPTFFLKVLGKEFKIPLLDIPVSLGLGKQDFIFDPVRVHVPLPDFEPVEKSLSFGKVELGKDKRLAIALSNVGEAKARATAFVDSKMTSVFKSSPAEVIVLSQQQEAVEIAFHPQTEGAVETKLTFVTNDPDERFLTVTLRGEGVPTGTDTTTPLADPKPKGQAGDDGGCGCRTAGSPSAGSPFMYWGLAASVLLIRRRRRRGRRAA